MTSFTPSTRRALAYATTGFSSAILNNIFGLYLIDLFLTTNHLEEKYFYQAQVCYAIWNAINDPLFGWILDHTNLTGDKRLPAILYGGPLWALVFLIPWFRWGEAAPWLTGLHFLFSLCIFDAFLTYVLLVHSALLADLTPDNKERNKMNSFAAYGGLIGYCLSSCSYFFWDKSNLGKFQLFCLLCAFIACWGFIYTGTQLRGFLHAPNNNHQLKKQSQSTPYGQFLKQILTHRNFWFYVMMNFVQNFNAYFDNNFFTMFDDKVFKPVFSKAGRQVTIFLHLVLPKMMVQVMTPFANRYGTYNLILWCTVTKLLSSIAMYMFGMSQDSFFHTWAFFFIAIRLSNCSWGFYNLVMSDVIDEDMVKHRRGDSVAVSIHGIQALFVKPAQSLAPLMGVWHLSKNEDYKLPSEQLDMEARLDIRTTMFNMACLVPLLCAAVQLLIWSNYSLHGKALKQLKETLTEERLMLKSDVERV